MITVGYPRTLILPSIAAVAVAWLWLNGPATGGISSQLLLAIGIGAWTLLEYVLHRWVLHFVEPFHRWHVEHHLHPDVPIRIPVWFSLILLLPLVGLPPLLGSLTGPAAAWALGVLIGHLAQETVHNRLHRPTVPGQSWLARRWREHNFHHQNDETVAFGTLTAFWDRVFRTSVSP